MAELLPCPFCGNGDVTLRDDSECQRLDGVFPYWVMCRYCQAMMQCFGTEKEAIKAWNTRA